MAARLDFCERALRCGGAWLFALWAVGPIPRAVIGSDAIPRYEHGICTNYE